MILSLYRKSKVNCLLVTLNLLLISMKLDFYYKVEKLSCSFSTLVSEIIVLYSKMATKQKGGAEISTLIKPFLSNTLHSLYAGIIYRLVNEHLILDMIQNGQKPCTTSSFFSLCRISTWAAVSLNFKCLLELMR